MAPTDPVLIDMGYCQDCGDQCTYCDCLGSLDDDNEEDFGMMGEVEENEFVNSLSRVMDRKNDLL